MPDLIIEENTRRLAALAAPFDPLTGEGSVGERQQVYLPDFLEGARLYLPLPLLNESQLWQRVLAAGTIHDFLRLAELPVDEPTRSLVAEALIRTRMAYDFPFWAAAFVKIKKKGGGEDIFFRLNWPQRNRLIPAFEHQRLRHLPIRLVLLKARQWGGSTATQMYYAWMQTVLCFGLNSLIVGHQSAAAIEVEDMFKKMLDAYPTRLLYPLVGADQQQSGVLSALPNRPSDGKFVSVFGHPNIHRIPQRNCKIKIGTAQNPDSARGGDYNLVHCTEVGLWVKTEGKSPEDIVQSATSGVLLQPNTAIVYESTAKGTGNFFHREYLAAKRGKSQFQSLFVPWFQIEQYSLPFNNQADLAQFAQWLYSNRRNTHPASNREESGAYLWGLWNLGATLQAIHWYVEERKKYSDSAYMYSEYPSTDEEAFVYAGEHVFDRNKVELLRSGTYKPHLTGDIQGNAAEGAAALQGLQFIEDPTADLWIWDMPEHDPANPIANRYIVAVDIGGRSRKADWSVILVIDRYWLLYQDKPVVVAQMHYHTDMDLLAWKAAQVAAFYNNALLVIESNTLETHDKDRQVDGDNSAYILDQLSEYYPNLYARRQNYEDIRDKRPLKYGFHTNPQTKPILIANLVRMIRQHAYVERDPAALDEYFQYERKPNGAFGAIDGYHDDLLMARAIALYVSTYEQEPPAIIRPLSASLSGKEIVSAATI